MTDQESPNPYGYSSSNSMTSSQSGIGLTSEAPRFDPEGFTSNSLKLKIQKWSSLLAFLPFELDFSIHRAPAGEASLFALSSCQMLSFFARREPVPVPAQCPFA
jgi:hypothetical protein